MITLNSLKSAIVGVIFCSTMLAATSAEATILKYVYTGSDGSASWIMDSTPVVLASGMYFADVVVSNGTGEIDVGGSVDPVNFSDVTFFLSGSGGGRPGGFVTSGGGPGSLIEPGRALFSGSTVTPTFFPSAFVYHQTNGTVSVSAVPEPATWAMMILGLGAAGFAMRRSRQVALT